MKYYNQKVKKFIKTKILFSLCLVICFVVLINIVHATSTVIVESPFVYSFNIPGSLEASTYMENSTSPYFWISSGGRMIIKDGVGETIQGPLSVGDPEQVNYATVNPLDTVGGLYPQNTFRLITRNTWENTEEEAYFNIVKTNLTDTPNREGYSGLLLFSRHMDSNNLYYAGIRQDGLAIIKKKIDGVYYSLIYKQVFGNYNDYNKITNPNLMPQNQWLGLRLRTTTNIDGTVDLNLMGDLTGNGDWVTLLNARDNGVGGSTLTSPGSGGIRTDYMDVKFKDFQIKKI